MSEMRYCYLEGGLGRWRVWMRAAPNDHTAGCHRCLCHYAGVTLAAMTFDQMDGTDEAGPGFAWLGVQSHVHHCIVFAAAYLAKCDGNGAEMESLGLLAQSSFRSLGDIVVAILQRLAKMAGGEGCAHCHLQQSHSALDKLRKVDLQKRLAALEPVAVPAFAGIHQGTEDNAPAAFDGFHHKDLVMFVDDFSVGDNLASGSL
jgi:hypothetical protein